MKAKELSKQDNFKPYTLKLAFMKEYMKEYMKNPIHTVKHEHSEEEAAGARSIDLHKTRGRRGTVHQPEERDYTVDGTSSLFEAKILIPVTIICIVLFVLGVTGNLITILIFKRYKDMRSTVNMYLSSMAVSDILIFLCLPSDLYRIWKYKPYIFGDFICKFLIYLSETCTYSTILHITTVSVERYLAICFPLKAKIMITKKRVKIIIGILWIIASVTSGPVLFLFGVEHTHGTQPAETIECRHLDSSTQSGLLRIAICVSTIYFFIPTFFLTLLYGLICKKLWSNTNDIQGPTVTNRGKHHKQTVKMLALVVLSFVLCWLPFHIGRLLFVWAGIGEFMFYDLTQYFNLISMVLFYLSASINPMLYNIMSQKYRAAMSKILKPRQDSQLRNTTRSEQASLEGTEITSFK
ncbi:PREDICTED: growth hormone secretagogue receptor type 1-like [Nanorana parkeri]|uniref:growth hormone secretagogue receptor type 1-like n=1 Tax=Nanorana parkeri TaxID=125878 RepID=UPI0008544AB1|nr:PREDICTED: growth hormone secretagogue receptor type 1-like [Nanorana parkeri]